MNIILLCTIVIIVILLYKLFKNIKYNNLITIICTILIIQIIFKPKLCMDAAIIGAKLFFKSVFPSLFPFIVLCNLIIGMNGAHLYSKVFGKFLCKPLKLPSQCSIVIIISILCGYPLGAKYCCDLYEKKQINFDTFERLLNIASNASPLFVIGTIGSSMLKNVNLGYLLLFSNYISCFCMGIILKSKNNIYDHSEGPFQKYNSSRNMGHTFQKSISDAITTSLTIGGFVTFFSVLIIMFKESIIFNIIISNITSNSLHNQILTSFLLGLVEITNGCSMISSLTINMLTKIIFISFLISFSGISIIMQVYSFCYKYKFSLKKYILRKILQGILCSLISIVLYFIFYNQLSISASTLNETIISIPLLYMILTIILLVPVIIKEIVNLFHFS